MSQFYSDKASPNTLGDLTNKIKQLLHSQRVVDARRTEQNAKAWEEIVKQLTREQDRFTVVELAHNAE